MPACPRCKHDHPPANFTNWAWAVRDAKDKPAAGQIAVLLILGTRLHPRTGCGWINREQLMADLDVKKDTVTRATIWAADHMLLRRLVRGHRTWDGGATDSLWALCDPSRAQTGAVEEGAATAQEGAVDEDTKAQTGAVDGAHKGANGGHTTAQMGAPTDKPIEVKPVGAAQPHPPDADPAASNGAQPRKRGTRIPPDFPEQLRSDPRHAAWFRRECPDVDGRVELAQFMDWWTSKTGKDATKQDWFATWRNWMRKEQKTIDRRRPPGPRGQPAADPRNEWMVNRS